MKKEKPQLTDRITIPPEALRAAARALHDASGTADCWDSMWDEMARAALKGGQDE